MVSVVPQNKYSIFSPLRFTDTSQYGRVSPVIGGYGVNDPPPSRYGEKGSRHANLRCKKKNFFSEEINFMKASVCYSGQPIT